MCVYLCICKYILMSQIFDIANVFTMKNLLCTSSLLCITIFNGGLGSLIYTPTQILDTLATATYTLATHIGTPEGPPHQPKTTYISCFCAPHTLAHEFLSSSGQIYMFSTPKLHLIDAIPLLSHYICYEMNSDVTP